MNDATVDAVSRVLALDSSISPEQRKNFLAYLRRGGEPTKSDQSKKLTAGYVRRAEAAEALGKSLRTIDNLIEQGLLVRVKWPNRNRAVGITLESLNKLLLCDGGAQ